MAEGGSYNLKSSKIEDNLKSCDLQSEQRPSWHQFIDASNTQISSCRDTEHANVNSLGSIDTNESIHSSEKSSNDSPLSTITQEHSQKLSEAGGAIESRKGVTSLVNIEGRSDNYGNTSVPISDCLSTEYFDEVNFDRAEQGIVLNTSDEEEMRLRFNNKRNRNGNPLCTYEAFKPTRFNLYTNSDEPSWSTIKKDNSLESSSPTIKKKSVTAKLNPLIGARLARDESPPSARYSGGAEKPKYTVTQKYEDKIRALQQQRQKERSRRRNHSSRVDENLDLTFRAGDNLDLTFSPDIYPPSHAEFQKYRSNPTASLPYYLISDEGDSVAVQLSDFALGSQGIKNDKKKKGKDKSKAFSPPVDRVNEQRHYLYNTDDRPRKQNGIIQNLESHKRVLQSYANRHCDSSSAESKTEELGTDSYENNDNYSNGNCTNRNNKQSYKYETIRSGREENSERALNSPTNDLELSSNRASSPVSVTYTGQIENGLNKSRSGKRLQANETVQHVTVKCGEISQPLSPRLVMAPENKDVTFKQFSTSCASEDVASFLVENIRNDLSRPKMQASVIHKRSDIERAEQSVVQERPSMDCNVADVASNISKHVVGFCSVNNLPSHKEIVLFVTDLDTPNAASPLSSNGQPDSKGKT